MRVGGGGGRFVAEWRVRVFHDELLFLSIFFFLSILLSLLCIFFCYLFVYIVIEEREQKRRHPGHHHVCLCLTGSSQVSLPSSLSSPRSHHIFSLCPLSLLSFCLSPHLLLSLSLSVVLVCVCFSLLLLPLIKPSLSPTNLFPLLSIYPGLSSSYPVVPFSHPFPCTFLSLSFPSFHQNIPVIKYSSTQVPVVASPSTHDTRHTTHDTPLYDTSIS